MLDNDIAGTGEILVFGAILEPQGRRGCFRDYLGCNSVLGQELDSCVVVWLAFLASFFVVIFVVVLALAFV